MILSGVYAVVILLLLFLIYFRIEKVHHQKNITSIPIRIWVNGTRGKSSVTRLIGAGLRATGKKVIAKTTGTKARFITKNDFELPVLRLGKANIKEQIGILKMAAKEKPDAVVLECMALRPDLQRTESIQIVQPTVVVITNVRADHLDVMGPTIKDIAKTFIHVAPDNCRVFTTTSHIFDDCAQSMNRKNITISFSDAAAISDSTMKKFSYIEHKENVALALDVCEYFGIERKNALQEMYHAYPDPGVLQKYVIDFDGKKSTLIYAMAVNDPDSTYRIWQTIDKGFPEIAVLINCRSDRIDRSIQLAGLVSRHLTAHKYILTGAGTDIVKRIMVKTINKNSILDSGNREPHQVYHAIGKFIADNSLIFAIGNTVGYGEQLIAEFLKHEENAC
jgi:poly-gamma-glutamate synthase PgsB/CapB